MFRFRWLGLVCLFGLMIGCDETKIEYSEPMTELAVVSEVVYTPSRHDTSMRLTDLDDGFDDDLLEDDLFNTRQNSVFSEGRDPFTGNKKSTVNLGGVRLTTTEVPEKFAVVFKCQHGKFIITKKAVYDKLKSSEGQKVEVSYREVYRATYKTENNERQLVSRVMTEYDFLGVELR